MTLAGVILAAGRGTRFGGDKLLARLPSGITVIEQTAQRMATAVDETVCVLRAEDIRLQQHLTALGFQWAIAKAADDGMSQSLKAGIAHFPTAEGWLIGLGDMPYVAVNTYQALCQRFRDLESAPSGNDRGWIVVPAVVVPIVVERGNGQAKETAEGRLKRGNPVLFSRYFGSELNQLTGDVGGKAVINGHPERVVMVPVDDSSILQDIDRPEDIR